MTPEECTPGTAVWAPLGSTGWRPAVVVGPAKGRVRLEFESGSKGTGTRRAESLRPRNPARKGKDKPPTGRNGGDRYDPRDLAILGGDPSL